MARLLVSVRSPAEAEAALAGGAALIDVKEPARGPLGRADDTQVMAILQTVAGRRPVSAALGELLDQHESVVFPGLAYAKWGLAGCAGRPDWQQRFWMAMSLLPSGCQAVVTAYADWQAAGAPAPEAVGAWAREQRLPLLLDTWAKTGQTLLDYVPAKTITRLCEQCRRAGVMAALAGSLDVPQIEQLRCAAPDWFAVRGAACHDGQREQGIDPERVRRLGQAASGVTAARAGS